MAAEQNHCLSTQLTTCTDEKLPCEEEIIWRPDLAALKLSEQKNSPDDSELASVMLWNISPWRRRTTWRWTSDAEYIYNGQDAANYVIYLLLGLLFLYTVFKVLHLPLSIQISPHQTNENSSAISHCIFFMFQKQFFWILTSAFQRSLVAYWSHEDNR